jgi:hypothetical protein
MPTSKVELNAAIRRDVRAGLSGRAIERKHGVGRRTVVAAMSSAWPAPRKKLPRRVSKLDPFKPVVDAILRADLNAPRKQRHTVTRLYARLIASRPAPTPTASPAAAPAPIVSAVPDPLPARPCSSANAHRRAPRGVRGRLTGGEAQTTEPAGPAIRVAPAIAKLARSARAALPSGADMPAP